MTCSTIELFRFKGTLIQKSLASTVLSFHRMLSSRAPLSHDAVAALENGFTRFTETRILVNPFSKVAAAAPFQACFDLRWDVAMHGCCCDVYHDFITAVNHPFLAFELQLDHACVMKLGVWPSNRKRSIADLVTIRKRVISSFLLDTCLQVSLASIRLSVMWRL